MRAAALHVVGRQRARPANAVVLQPKRRHHTVGSIQVAVCQLWPQLWPSITWLARSWRSNVAALSGACPETSLALGIGLGPARFILAASRTLDSCPFLPAYRCAGDAIEQHKSQCAKRPPGLANGMCTEGRADLHSPPIARLGQQPRRLVLGVAEHDRALGPSPQCFATGSRHLAKTLKRHGAASINRFYIAYGGKEKWKRHNGVIVTQFL